MVFARISLTISDISRLLPYILLPGDFNVPSNSNEKIAGKIFF